MNEVIIIGVDLAKNVFQVHGAAADGTAIFQKKLSRPQFQRFMTEVTPCLVAMEACATSHYWAREIAKLGHEVRLIAPNYVKPFVKRQKNDAADAEAIVEAAQRPNMRFVPVKSADTQAQTMLFRTREQLIGQRTGTINALRGHLAEFGVIVATGITNLPRLAERIEAPDSELPDLARDMARMHLDRIAALTAQIDDVMAKIKVIGTASRDARILRSMPGIGPICAMAIEAFAPPIETFKSGRDFAAWLGLIPRQYSSGGKQVLGKTLKDGSAGYPAPVDYWGDELCRTCGAFQTRGLAVASGQIGPQAQNGGGYRFGKQDGASDLGHADEGRRIPASGGMTNRV